MVGIVLCSHAGFASGLKEAGEMLAGPQERFEAITFDGFEDLLELGERVKDASITYEDGCIYLCDILNGTPFNACALAIAETNNVILTGMSLPMVIELLILRNSIEDLDALVEEVIKNSPDYVNKRVSQDFFAE